MDIGFLDVLVFILVFQSIGFIGFLFYTDRGNRGCNLLIGVFQLILVIRIVSYYLLNPEHVLFGFSYALAFAYGPVLFIFFKTLLEGKAYAYGDYWKHFLPFLFFWGTYPFFYKRIYLFEFMIAISIWSYHVLTIVYFLKSKRNRNMDMSHVNYKWVTYFMVLLTLLFSTAGLITFFMVSGNLPAIRFVFGLQMFAHILIINFFLFHGLSFGKSFLGYNGIHNRNTIPNKPVLSKEELDYYACIIKSSMEKERIFLDPELSLISISQRLSIGPNILSRVIHQKFNTNFSDFVNNYRVNHAKTLLNTSNTISKNVSEVMFESGFNSKSTFYRHFKDKTGISPKEYRFAHDK
ncbi:AraC family transcriptional regulator [Muricauda sp. CAU 1633]|uniref:helix-turn-helix domain-containing protein n=1 Tax=Allomuricauda sp. CAU 1633 TaxID=2816036 RepID=UPI001A8DAE1F|nr:helix-turn-helix domain-containing protein [Muricauda sp. CAU 1633]MBO0322649.1 AraC family transcriptional regulator [Muricauda sp. CAU 1633]